MALPASVEDSSPLSHTTSNLSRGDGQATTIDPQPAAMTTTTTTTTTTTPHASAADAAPPPAKDTANGAAGPLPEPGAPAEPSAASTSPPPVAPQVPSPPTSVSEARGSQQEKGGDKPNGATSAAPSPTEKPNGTTAPKSKPAAGSGAPPKHRVLNKLLRVLIPCAFSSSTTHQLDLDIDSVTAVASKEKPASVSTEPVPSNPVAATPPQDDVPTEALSAPAVTANVDHEAAVPIPDTPPPPPAPEDIFIPPTPPPHLLPLDETEGLTSGAVQAPGSTGDSPIRESKRHSRDSTPPSNSSTKDSDASSFTEDDDIDPLDDLDIEDKLIMNGGAGIPIGPDGVPKPLLPPISPKHAGRKCLVLDLDETLVHSSFKSLPQADYVVPVEIEYHWHNVYVIKRPGVDNFLKKMGEIYEVVVFTASLSKYADPVLDKLDIHQVVSHRLFRESCYNHKGNYVKDLSQLGRPITDTIILDNSPASYIFHPNNAVPVSSWFNDPHDTELTDLVPFLADLASVDDVRGILDGAR